MSGLAVAGLLVGPVCWPLEARVVERIRVVVNNDIITQTDVHTYRRRVQQALLPDSDMAQLNSPKRLVKQSCRFIRPDDQRKTSGPTGSTTWPRGLRSAIE